MAASTKANAVIFNEELYSGIIEVLEQNSEDIAAGTRGAIQYVTQSLKGDFEESSFWELGDGLVHDRDTTATTDVDITGFSQESMISPKMNLRLGPKQATKDQFRKLQEDPATMSFIFGTKLGKELSVEWLNRALAAGVGCLTKDVGTHYDATVNTDPDDQLFNTRIMNRGLNKFGDKRDKIVAWVAHSNAVSELIEDQILEKLDSTTGQVVYGASPATLSRNLYQTDSPALIDVDEVTGDVTYTILGLTENALVMRESEGGVDMDMLPVLGKENIMNVLQGETAVNVSVKGFSYSGAGAATMETIGNSANWTQAMAQVKSVAGIAITVNSRENA